ncbi:MAG: phospholipid carrier-dependent glycosyltransferase [Ruminococcaceae bacterium]|nr:phospholipid carrier-dependent glycosyltransferase [Oscillospiraceae bacterium]
MGKRLSAGVLSLVILLSACVYFFFSEQKEGFHCDEIYSFGLSNSTFHYEMYNEDGSIRWNTAEDIDAYMTASDEHRFDYANVYKNQAEDVHPPLFYIFMHTFSSFTPGEYSIYHAIITNMLFAAGATIFLYLIMLKISKKRSSALIAATIYALSVNCINMVTYLRMYEILTFFTTAAIYVHLVLAENEYKLTWKRALALGTVIFFGAYTQYYFFIFMTGLALWTIVDILRCKRKKELLRYLGVIAVVAAIYAAVWPYVFGHLFGSVRGEEAFANMVSSSFAESLVFYLNVIRNGVGNLFSAIVVAATTFLICAKSERGLCRRIASNKNFFMILFVALFYFLIILRVSPYQTDRYIAPIFPIFSIIITFSLGYAYSRIVRVCSEKLAVSLLSILLIFGISTGIYDAMYGDWGINWDSNYLYDIPEEHQRIFDEHSGKKCIMIRKSEAYALWNMPDYKHFEETAFVFPDEIEMLSENNHLKDETEFILYMSIPVDSEENIARIKEALGFDNHQFLISAEQRNHSNIYLVSKENVKEIE